MPILQIIPTLEVIEKSTPEVDDIPHWDVCPIFKEQDLFVVIQALDGTCMGGITAALLAPIRNKVSNTNNTNKVNSSYTNNADFVDAMTLINFANQYGTNSTEFKKAYNRASKVVQRTYDNNYR